MKKAILVSVVALALAGCGQKVDTSSPQAFTQSLAKMTEKMSAGEKADFHEAMVAIASDSADPSPLLDGADVTSPLFWGTADKIKGMTAKDIVRLGFQTELANLDKAIAEDAGAVQRIKAERQKYGAVFDNVHLDNPRYHVESNGFMEQPVISFTITNGSKVPIKKIYVHGILSSPGRALPWVTSDFNYEFAGGLEPGESKPLDLEPNMFGDWQINQDYSGRPDLKLALSLTNVADASGQDLLKGDPGDASAKEADAAAKQHKRQEVQAKMAKIA